ncbi:MAG TPA: hypothetical protein DCY35_03775 [Prolixibacteraceae bacterium]|nr:hypothetical protein [Prolixibacteraceae bacterium]
MENEVIYESVSGLRRTNRKLVVCPYCHGTGTITRKKFYGHTEGYVNQSYSCGVCQGSRVLERVVTIEFNKV